MFNVVIMVIIVMGLGRFFMVCVECVDVLFLLGEKWVGCYVCLGVVCLMKCDMCMLSWLLIVIRWFLFIGMLLVRMWMMVWLSGCVSFIIVLGCSVCSLVSDRCCFFSLKVVISLMLFRLLVGSGCVVGFVLDVVVFGVGFLVVIGFFFMFFMMMWLFCICLNICRCSCLCMWVM